jgi:hypothetical protein
MGRDDLRRHLAPTATIRERVEGLLAVGLSAAELSEVTRTTESTVRNWVAGDTEPRPDAEMALDYLRAVAKALLDGGMAPDRALRWLMSLDPDRFGTERPIDVLRTTPMRVLSAALDVTLDEPGVVV